MRQTLLRTRWPRPACIGRRETAPPGPAGCSYSGADARVGLRLLPAIPRTARSRHSACAESSRLVVNRMDDRMSIVHHDRRSKTGVVNCASGVIPAVRRASCPRRVPAIGKHVERAVNQAKPAVFVRFRAERWRSAGGRRGSRGRGRRQGRWRPPRRWR